MSLLTNLVSYWKFDETSGNTLNDSHGSNDGTIYGATINQTGKINKAYSFDGDNDYIFRDSTSFQIETISFWVYTDIVANNYQIIFSFNTERQYDITIGRVSGYTTDETLGIRTQTGSAGPYLTTYIRDTFTEGWHHIAFVWNSSTTQYDIYVNNDKKTTYKSHGTSDGHALKITTTDHLMIGKKMPGTAYWYSGKLDEAGIWSRALTVREVSRLYNGGYGLTYPFTGRSIFTGGGL